MNEKGIIFNIQRFSIQDGPGVRTTVFFKSCPLKCDWCSNPESQKHFPEVAHHNSECNKCGHCVDVCDVGAVSLIDKGVTIDRRICTNCSKCIEVCPLTALKVYGNEMEVEEVMDEIKRDELYYRNSGGGVTASGGEPLSQPDFLVALFERCYEKGFHTTLDTCGYVSEDILARVLETTDLVLYDLKHMDSTVHKRVTGVSNEQILANARMIAAKGIPIIFRIPLIPGINDSEQNIKATARFVIDLKPGSEIDLLPYHRLGISKYESLDRTYEIAGLLSPQPEQIEKLERIIEDFGLTSNIV